MRSNSEYLQICKIKAFRSCITVLSFSSTLLPQTTVYKAGFSTVGDLYNLITKIITKYPVLATYKILKITKKTSPIFFCNFENFISC